MAKKVEKVADSATPSKGSPKGNKLIREKYGSLLESVPDAILIVDRQGRICFGNAQVMELFGYRPEELVGEKVDLLIPERYEKKHQEDLRTYFSQPRRRSMGTGLDIMARHKDGREFSVDIGLSPLPSEEGVFAVAAIRDMTQRKAAEEQIRMNYHLQRALCSILHGSLEPIPLEKQLEQILEKILTVPHLALHSQGAIYLVDEKPDVLVLKAHRGFDPEHLRTCRQVSFGSCLCGAAAESKQVLFTTGIDGRHQLREGALHPHGHYCVPIVCGNKTLGLLNIAVKEGHPRSRVEEEFLTAVASMLAGIIERKRAEQAVAESEKKYRTLIENVNVGVYRNTVGPRGRFLQANPAIAQMFGYDSVEDFMMVSVADLYRNPEERRAVIDEVLQQGFIRDKGIHLKKKDGTPILGSFTARVHYNEAGEAQWLDGVIEDITERKEAEAEKANLQRKLAASEKYAALGRLTQNIAHEIRNPLTAVGGFAKRLQQHLDIGGKEEKYVDLILSDVQRLEEILKNVLTFSRDEELHLELVRLPELLDPVLRSLEETLRGHSIVLDKVYGKAPDLALDREQVREALEAMISNAIAAMPRGGTLTIRTGELTYEGQVYFFLSFQDTGEGIPPSVQEKIFEPFFTGEGVVPGVRLGLPICKKVMESHGGMIQVESVPGEGTLFRLCFPRRDFSVGHEGV